MTEHDKTLDEQGSRRRFLKQAATVAWASPFIVTMMSRAAHAAHGGTCGTQDVTELGGCAITAPCGSAHACVPDPTDLGPGNDCICVSAPNP